MSGSGREPGPHRAGGVGVAGGSVALPAGSSRERNVAQAASSRASPPSASCARAGDPPATARKSVGEAYEQRAMSNLATERCHPEGRAETDERTRLTVSARTGNYWPPGAPWEVELQAEADQPDFSTVQTTAPLGLNANEI
jgi:hypothetical protein